MILDYIILVQKVYTSRVLSRPCRVSKVLYFILKNFIFKIKSLKILNLFEENRI